MVKGRFKCRPKLRDVHEAVQFLQQFSTPLRRVTVLRQLTAWLHVDLRPLHVALYVLDHVVLPFRIGAALLRADVVIVREFSHVLAPWVLWPLRQWRHRIVLFVHRVIVDPATVFERRHNSELVRLCRLGFNLMALESAEGLHVAGAFESPGSGKIFAINFVLSQRSGYSFRAFRRNPKVAVVGQVRPEKGVRELLEILLDVCARRGWQLMCGVPSVDFALLKGMPDGMLRDTTTERQYQDLIQEADVVCVNLQRREYMYRASGVVADSLSMCRPVVAPKLHVVHRQLSVPATVGGCFVDLSGIEQAIEQVLQSHGLSEAFDTQFAARSIDKVRDAFWLALQDRISASK